VIFSKNIPAEIKMIMKIKEDFSLKYDEK